MPLPEVHLARKAIGQRPGEGTQEEDEQGKNDESAQPPPDTTITSTQPPPTTTTQAPILTSTSTTPLPTPSGIFVTTSTTLLEVTTILSLVVENVSIYNMESDFDQEDEQCVVQLVQRRTGEKKEKKFTKLKKQAPVDPMNIDEQGLLDEYPLGGERAQNEPEDSQDERLVLTPKDQEDLLKEIAAKQGMQETDKGGREFEEEMSDRLGELHKRQQLNIYVTLQTAQITPATST